MSETQAPMLTVLMHGGGGALINKSLQIQHGGQQSRGRDKLRALSMVESRVGEEGCVGMGSGGWRQAGTGGSVEL